MLLSKLARPFWSGARRFPGQNGAAVVMQPVRHGSKKTMYVFASNSSQRRFKKYLIRYFLLGLVPFLSVVFYTTCIMGEAELYDYDPELYQPEFQEFFPHPLTRFMAKYCVEDPRINHYKMIYALEFEGHHRRMTQLVNSVAEIEKHMDFRGWTRPSGDGTVRSPILKRDLEKYVEEHEIGIKVKR